MAPFVMSQYRRTSSGSLVWYRGLAAQREDQVLGDVDGLLLNEPKLRSLRVIHVANGEDAFGALGLEILIDLDEALRVEVLRRYE